MRGAFYGSHSIYRLGTCLPLDEVERVVLKPNTVARVVVNRDYEYPRLLLAYRQRVFAKPVEVVFRDPAQVSTFLLGNQRVAYGKLDAQSAYVPVEEALVRKFPVPAAADDQAGS
ncbi:MAG: hypothetical protein NZ482_03680 [Gloeomargarita sp. SKYG98]|nr:hypothetical protein [Gloeomargarita sp. SKYG98]